MKLSLTLVSLGLCVAPAFAQSVGKLIFTSEKETWEENPKAGECIPNWNPEIPVNEIDIQGEFPSIKYLFYTEEDCKGLSTTLREGKHKFSKDFYVNSFLCRNPLFS
ncbi:hypothetical protein FE257_008270 [Aspergillus nanangensis]|uniref:Uncharacterized protein n=1 Tax=Aspergillus nanangensis TaxID=2582783 RepID=A0AAD4CLU5_ASPNN|nr:hypothetical protein FE257_008270 [Aspergillus nanangensis]